MGIFGGAIIAIMVADACFSGLNKGVPGRVHQQNFGLVDILYRLINIIAIVLVGFYFISWLYVIIGIILFFVAYGIKKLTWHLAYGI